MTQKNKKNTTFTLLLKLYFINFSEHMPLKLFEEELGYYSRRTNTATNFLIKMAKEGILESITNPYNIRTRLYKLNKKTLWEKIRQNKDFQLSYFIIRDQSSIIDELIPKKELEKL